jgi:hypothetical protein
MWQSNRMDFTLIPICSEIEHHLEYDKILRSYCAFCGKESISYRCINCEHGLCNTCYRDKMTEEELNDRFSYNKLRRAIIGIKDKLKQDKIFSDWFVGVSKESDEIYFYNPITRTLTYDYPLSPSPPSSPTPLTSDTPLSAGAPQPRIPKEDEE